MPLATTAATTSAYGTKIWDASTSTNEQLLKITAGYIANSYVRVAGAASFSGKYDM